MNIQNQIYNAIIAVAFVSITVTIPIQAGIDDSFDWVDDPDTGLPKRKLCVCYKFDTTTAKLGDQLLDDIMDEAILNWNGVKDQTGWEFIVCTDTCDIEVVVDSGLTERGGASTSGFPSSSSTNRTVSKLKIKFDPTPAGGYEWDQQGKSKDKTKNPVSSAKHELSHTMRLDHQGMRRSISRRIKDTQGIITINDDVIDITEEDIDEAATSAVMNITFVSASGGNGKGVFLDVSSFPFDIPIYDHPPHAVLMIQSNAFESVMDVLFSRTSLLSMPTQHGTLGTGLREKDNEHLNYGLDRLVKGVHIDVIAPSGIPLFNSNIFYTVIIPYEDGVEGDGYLIDIADPDYGEVIEEFLEPYVFDHVSETWIDLATFSSRASFVLNTNFDFVEVTLPAPTLYRFPNQEYSNAGTLFIAIGGPFIPEPHMSVILLISIIRLYIVFRQEKYVLVTRRFY